MVIDYKGYKIITESQRTLTSYDVYCGSQCHATGHVFNDSGETAEYAAKHLIDTKFQTDMLLKTLRFIPRPYESR